MAQPLSDPRDRATDYDDRILLFPTRPAAEIPSEQPGWGADHLIVGPLQRIRTHVIHQVVVFEVAGRLSDVVRELDRGIQEALAEGPRGVVCNLAEVLKGAEPIAIKALASAGRHVRDWSGMPVTIACPDPRLRAALGAYHLGGHLIVTESILPALSAVLETRILSGQLGLVPHPTAPRAAREFVARTLTEWGMAPLVSAASLVVSELVTIAMDSETDIDIDLSVAWHLGTLRLAVRESGPGLTRNGYARYRLHRREENAIAGLSRAFGVLPAADGGRTVWAVLNAAGRPSSA
jgi:hypothetical protein